MLVAAALSALLAVGAAAAALLTISACAAALARAKPVRWVFRKLVGEPLTLWFRAQVSYVVEPSLAEIHAQLKPNGGHSLRDRVDRIEGLLRGDDPAREALI